MAQEQKLEKADFSAVWKDGGNQMSGLKLDLVEHLKRQRKDATWNEAKAFLIQKLNFAQVPNEQQIKMLQIGCGLGIDVLYAAQQASQLGKKLTIIGIDFNSTMLEQSAKLIEQSKPLLSQNIKIQIKRGDISSMEFADETFDLIRSDITIMHLPDFDKATKEIHRVLKVGGRLLTLEGGSSDTFSTDTQIIKIYDKVLPPKREGGVGIKMLFSLPSLGFEVTSNTPFSIVTNGEAMAFADKDWVKLNGMGAMLVSKGILSQQEADDFKQRYIQACTTNQIMSVGIMFVSEFTKTK